MSQKYTNRNRGAYDKHKGHSKAYWIYRSVLRNVYLTCENFYSYLSKSRRRMLAAKCVTGALILIPILLMIYGSVTKINAYTVYLDNTRIGSVAKPKKGSEDLAEQITKTVVNKLNAQTLTNTRINEKISIKPVHSTRNQKADDIVNEICKKVTYQVEASVIYVDGVKMANMRNDSEAHEVLDNIKAKKYTTSTPTHFKEDVVIEHEFMNETELESVDTVFLRLYRFEKAIEDYVVQEGDYISTIASREKITQERILFLNEGLTLDTKLKIGQVLKIEREKWLLTVIPD